ncbi:uncharacterized protein [Watersipora subatra]|uniref:uncharacterized protein isoform X2 n=1 Tax=Watersipora subatra TaxID=2589382 RepID=UPI00355BB257
MKVTDSSQTKKMENRMANAEKYNVFLGGSCGGRKSPTTWRNKVAIPKLTAADVTFYNPQVETWTHDLIHKENKAKENSDWLLFMLEDSTRGIVSLVEVAYLVGSGRSVLFVLQQQRENGQLCIKDDTVSSLEVDDIRESQETLHSIINKHDCCQYSTVLETGLDLVIDGLRNNSSSLVQKTGHNSYSGKGEKKISYFLQRITAVLNIPIKHTDENGKKKRPGDLPITPHHRYSLGIIAAENPYNVVQQATQRLNSTQNDLYVSHGTAAKVLDTLRQCSVILVVIPSTALACSEMCKAVYLLSKHKNMVFCIQDIGEMTIDNGNSNLTKSAVDDFNRARAYVRDMAANHKSPVHTSFEEAMASTSKMLAGC